MMAPAHLLAVLLGAVGVTGESFQGIGGSNGEFYPQQQKEQQL